MAGPRRKKWEAGNIFLAYPRDKAQYSDRETFIAQIVDTADFRLLFAIFDQRETDLKSVLKNGPDRSKLISVVDVVRPSLSQGKIAGHADIIELPKDVQAKIQRLRDDEYIGARTISWSIVVNFVAAYRGEGPWNAYKKYPNYFDGMLIDQFSKPRGLLYRLIGKS